MNILDGKLMNLVATVSSSGWRHIHRVGFSRKITFRSRIEEALVTMSNIQIRKGLVILMMVDNRIIWLSSMIIGRDVGWKEVPQIGIPSG